MDFTLIELIILSLGTWRVSFIISKEDGPMDIFSKFRNHIGLYKWENMDMQAQADWLNSGNEPDEYIASTNMAKLIKCLGCLSVSVSAVLLVISLITNSMFIPGLFAISTLSIFIELIRKRL